MLDWHEPCDRQMYLRQAVIARKNDERLASDAEALGASVKQSRVLLSFLKTLRWAPPESHLYRFHLPHWDITSGLQSYRRKRTTCSSYTSKVPFLLFVMREQHTELGLPTMSRVLTILLSHVPLDSSTTARRVIAPAHNT